MNLNKLDLVIVHSRDDKEQYEYSGCTIKTLKELFFMHLGEDNHLNVFDRIFIDKDINCDLDTFRNLRRQCNNFTYNELIIKG